MTPAPTVRLTVAQAVVTYLSRQYSVADGERRRLIPATLGIFGHGNVAGLGQALDQLNETRQFIQGRNEHALVHAAVGFAKHSRRRATLAVTASIGPGAMNLVTGAALATALAGFMPSTQTLEREAQELAAIIECTDVEFLPPGKRDKLDKLGGREKLQERLTAIKQILDGQ